ncbi:DUF1727 domain-containing protein [Candidatus Daviesbacteria bacterium]|nr:DUF1727 domain-containing protein [Candidatus Daviesbacteria bacterium]
MKKFLAILLGKIIHKLTRTFKTGGGSAAPGLYALKVYPNLVEDFVKQIPKNVVITGTNGKTTTARLLDHFAKTSTLKVIRNHTGSNLERGIASALLSNSNFHPGGVRLNRADLGIWELDEAAFNSVAPKIKPDIIVFLNVFRDQLDRYGEVDIVVKKWCEALKKIPANTQILINGDDGNIVKLLDYCKGKAQKFGLQNYKIAGEHHKITAQKLDLEAVNIKQEGLSENSFQLLTSNINIQLPTSTIHLPVPGTYHIYDFLAAFAAGFNLGCDLEKMIESLKNFSPAFGRVEKFNFNGHEAFIFLIKNPAGTSQVFSTIAGALKKNDRLLLALNDNLADGTDISWIWDVDFEQINQSASLRKHEVSKQSNLERLPRRYAPRNDVRIICSGTRAQDLAVRLKYAGFDPSCISVENNLKKALEQAKTGLGGRLFVLPTYTALLGLQKILTNLGVKRHYWQEE